MIINRLIGWLFLIIRHRLRRYHQDWSQHGQVSGLLTIEEPMRHQLQAELERGRRVAATSALEWPGPSWSFGRRSCCGPRPRKPHLHSDCNRSIPFLSLAFSWQARPLFVPADGPYDPRVSHLYLWQRGQVLAQRLGFLLLQVLTEPVRFPKVVAQVSRVSCGAPRRMTCRHMGPLLV